MKYQLLLKVCLCKLVQKYMFFLFSNDLKTNYVLKLVSVDSLFPSSVSLTFAAVLSQSWTPKRELLGVFTQIYYYFTYSDVTEKCLKKN